jgi:hypothetical protein
MGLESRSLVPDCSIGVGATPVATQQMGRQRMTVERKGPTLESEPDS